MKRTTDNNPAQQAGAGGRHGAVAATPQPYLHPPNSATRLSSQHWHQGKSPGPVPCLGKAHNWDNLGQPVAPSLLHAKP